MKRRPSEKIAIEKFMERYLEGKNKGKGLGNESRIAMSSDRKES